MLPLRSRTLPPRRAHLSEALTRTGLLLPQLLWAERLSEMASTRRTYLLYVGYIGGLGVVESMETVVLLKGHIKGMSQRVFWISETDLHKRYVEMQRTFRTHAWNCPQFAGRVPQYTPKQPQSHATNLLSPAHSDRVLANCRCCHHMVLAMFFWTILVDSEDRVYKPISWWLANVGLNLSEFTPVVGRFGPEPRTQRLVFRANELKICLSSAGLREPKVLGQIQN